MSDRLPRPRPATADRRSGELTFREMLRWAWRQLTSMRTALVLLLLLALAAIPGSVIPQADVDALKTSQWQEAHPTLTPIYEKLGLFSVFDSAWFSAIYLLLMASLVGLHRAPQLRLLAAMRAAPPGAPRNLTRLPDHASYTHARRGRRGARARRARARDRRYRVGRHAPGDGSSAERATCARPATCSSTSSVLVVLVGFAIGSLFGYRGGVILVVGNGFSNNLTQYDDFVPGGLFDPDAMEPFSFDIDSFDIEWLTSGPAQGQAAAFVSHLTYRETPTSPRRRSTTSRSTTR